MNFAGESTVYSNPLSIIRSLHAKNPEILWNLSDVGKNFRAVLNEDFSKIPSINDVCIESISPNSLVRFTGMVQDMFDPEFYLGKFVSVNTETNENKTHVGCYTDCHELAPNEEIDFDNSSNITLERQTFYCVPAPGLSKWLKDDISVQCSEMTSSQSRVKRCISNDNDMESGILNENDNARVNNSKGNEQPSKLCKTDEKSPVSDVEQKVKKVDYTKNFPLPEETGQVCLIKMYADTGSLKLNDVLEFICVLSVDSVLAAPSLKSAVRREDMLSFDDINSSEEKAHCPPPSLVPRLHCLFYNKVTSLNQHVRNKSSFYNTSIKEIALIRSDVMNIFSQVFNGDITAAEYLLLHLTSKVYGRCGALCVGKFSLNITKCPTNGFTKKLYSVIEQIVEKSYFLPLTVNNLNHMSFIPKKDYEANRLQSGVLQLADDTQLVIDETQMQSGKLDSDGVRNLTALGNIIQWQKIDYDFQFSQLGILTNINTLVLSEGKSLMTCDCQLHLTHAPHTDVESLLNEDFLNRVRIYLAHVRTLEYTLTDEVQKALEEDFVEMRKADGSMNADIFYIMLTTARCMALSYGQPTLSSSLWVRTKELDDARRKRESVK